MTLDEGHKIRDSVLTEKFPLRLDCLNPFAALNVWRLPETGHEASIQDLQAKFHTSLNLPQRTSFLTKGVRSLLRTLMRTPTGQRAHWWIPGDVFPAYLNIAAEEGVLVDRYSLWPDLQLAPIMHGSGEKEFLLIPLPHSPMGYRLSTDQRDMMQAWLVQSPSRYLVVDLVYAYDHLYNPEIQEWASSSQAILAFSMSKTWLQRCLAGIAIVPDAFLEEVQPYLEIPSSFERGLALRCLVDQPDLPSRQAKRFETQWRSFSDKLKDIDLAWMPPRTGYLGVVKCHWQRLLDEHNVLAVPPALFGSPALEYSIISCLHDLPLG